MAELPLSYGGSGGLEEHRGKGMPERMEPNTPLRSSGFRASPGSGEGFS
jgi:hypothetical protein